MFYLKCSNDILRLGIIKILNLLWGAIQDTKYHNLYGGSIQWHLKEILNKAGITNYDNN